MIDYDDYPQDFNKIDHNITYPHYDINQIDPNIFYKLPTYFPDFPVSEDYVQNHPNLQQINEIYLIVLNELQLNPNYRYSNFPQIVRLYDAVNQLFKSRFYLEFDENNKLYPHHDQHKINKENCIRKVFQHCLEFTIVNGFYSDYRKNPENRSLNQKIPLESQFIANFKYKIKTNCNYQNYNFQALQLPLGDIIVSNEMFKGIIIIYEEEGPPSLAIIGPRQRHDTNFSDLGKNELDDRILFYNCSECLQRIWNRPSQLDIMAIEQGDMSVLNFISPGGNCLPLAIKHLLYEAGCIDTFDTKDAKEYYTKNRETALEHLRRIGDSKNIKFNVTQVYAEDVPSLINDPEFDLKNRTFVLLGSGYFNVKEIKNNRDDPANHAIFYSSISKVFNELNWDMSGYHLRPSGLDSPYSLWKHAKIYSYDKLNDIHKYTNAPFYTLITVASCPRKPYITNSNPFYKINLYDKYCGGKLGDGYRSCIESTKQLRGTDNLDYQVSQDDFDNLNLRLNTPHVLEQNFKGKDYAETFIYPRRAETNLRLFKNN